MKKLLVLVLALMLALTSMAAFADGVKLGIVTPDADHGFTGESVAHARAEAEARNEALKVLELVEGYEIKYPIYFDWEPISDGDARTASISSSELTRCAQAFCQTIESAGYRAGIYFNLDLASHYYHLRDLTEYTFWLAEYQDTPSFPYAFDMWQYSSTGEVPGISTIVDLNLSFLPIE